MPPVSTVGPDYVQKAIADITATIKCIREHVGSQMVSEQDDGHISIRWVPCPQCGRVGRW